VDAFERVFKRQVNIGCQVIATSRTAGTLTRPATCCTPEEVAEKVVEIGIPGTRPEAAEPSGPASSREPSRTQTSQFVVLLAALGITQHGIRLSDLFEASFGVSIIRMRIRVVFTSKLAIRLLDVVCRGVLGQPKDRVVVLLQPLALRGHQSFSSSSFFGHSSTVTIAARKTRSPH
jgi:hypothetical protein